MLGWLLQSNRRTALTDFNVMDWMHLQVGGAVSLHYE